MGFGTFGKEKERKVKLRKRFMCEKCAKTFTSDANLQRHFKTETHNQKKKVRNNRWKVMRHVKKLLKDAQYANELKRKSNVRLGICQKIYTTQFSGERILHTENA